MEAYKSLLKNIALLLFVGAIPSLCWASGLFTSFSWATCFLLAAGFFSVLWIRARSSSQFFQQLLLSRGDIWAICEGNQIVEKSPLFPVDSLHSLKSFFHPNSQPRADAAIHGLIHKNLPFLMRVETAKEHATYTFQGESFNEKFVFWLKDITDVARQERLHMEIFQKNETLLTNLQATLNALPILLWHRDEHQKINYCNLAYSKAVQALPQKVYEEDIELLQSRSPKIHARKAVHTGECQGFESAVIIDGDMRYFQIWEIPDLQNQGTTLGVAYDITELHTARTEIKRLINAQDEVLTHLSTAISVYDAEGTLQYYNQAYINLHSYDEEFLQTHPRLDEVLEDLRSRRQLPEYADFPAFKKERLLDLKEQVEPKEELMHLPDERTLRIFSAPHPMGGLLFILEDVTDYLALEGKNKTLLDAYQATLDNLFEGVIVIGSDNRLKIFNPSFVRLWNFDEEEIKSDQHLTVIVEKLKDHFDYEDNWESYKAQLIENITNRSPKTGQLKRKDGIVINFRYVPLPNGDYLLSYTDATDPSRIQKALQERKEALETADRIKSEFISNISYELRAPLNTIIEFTQILSHQYIGKLNEQQTNYINGVLDSSTKLFHLINDILDLASIEGGHLTLQLRSIHIPTLLEEIKKLISEKLKTHKQRLVLKCDSSLHEWVVDEIRLRQALFILLNNVIQFTPAEGIISLEAVSKGEVLEISIAVREENFALKEQIHLIEKLESGKHDLQTSVGLGLSLVNRLIELHEGHIHVFSESSKGTKITCFLPQISQKNHIKKTQSR